MSYKSHLILFLSNNSVGTGQAFEDIDLIQLAKEKLPEGTPFVVVEKSLQSTLPDKNWQNVSVDWSNPDGYGERVIPTPEE